MGRFNLRTWKPALFFFVFVCFAVFLFARIPLAATEVPAAKPAEKELFSWRTYNPKIPSPTEFFGYGVGEYHTTYAPMVLYFEELVRKSDRIQLKTYGESYEKRPLYYAVISSAENIGRIEEIKGNLSRLAHPDELRDSAEAERIIDTTPAVVFLHSTTHGNETTSFESAIHTAFQLVAAADQETQKMLNELVVIITPAMNPDSHERFVSWYNANQVGLTGTADPNGAEHFAPWGLNNNNHYQINLNRESCWNTQVEAEALVRLYLEWNPHVFIDHHGWAEGFIGPSYVEPINTEITANQRDWLARFGEELAQLFGEHNFRYTPWEFGILDPGYWEFFPLLNGAIAFSIESPGGSSAGLQRRLPGGHINTLKEGILNNILADQATMRLTARRRRQKLRDFLAYKRSALEEGKHHPVQSYVFPPSNDPQRLETVVNLLIRDGINVLQAREPFKTAQATPYLKGRPGPRSFPTGTYLVPMAQVQSRLLRVLMNPDTPIPKAYLEKVQEIRKLSETPGYLNPDIWATTEVFYDITAWSLPLTYDLEAYSLSQMPLVNVESVMSQASMPGSFLNPETKFAFIFDYSSNRAIRAIIWLRGRGLRFHVATSPFKIGLHAFGRGSIVIFKHENEEHDLAVQMRNLVQDTRITLLGVDKNLVDEGPHLGSDQFVAVVNSKLAVVMGGPVRPSSYGSIWFLFERVYDVPFTALAFERLLSIDLRDYGVLIFPDGFYAGLDKATESAIAKKLRRWVLEGGALVGLKGASAWFARANMGLTSVRTLEPYIGKSINMTDGGEDFPKVPVSEEDTAGMAGAGEPEPSSFNQQSASLATPFMPGAIFRGEVYPYHYLGYGYEGEVPVFIWSNLVFSAGKGVGVPVFFDKAGNALVAGFAFPDSVKKLAGTPYLMDEKKGLGHVVLYADDPNFRLYWDGLTRLFFNSVLFSNSF